MDNQEINQTSNNKNHQEDNSARDKIPLWLQGLDDSTDEQEGVKEKETDGEDIQPEVEWVKEISRQTEPEEQVVLHQSASEEIPEYPLSDQSMDEDKTKTVQTEERATIPSEDVEQPPKEKDFFEISDLSIPEDQEPFDKIKEDMIPDNEDLPDWLQEMIAEEPKDSLEETIPSVFDKKEEKIEKIEIIEEEENTEPIDITQETPVEEQEAPIDEEGLFNGEQEVFREPRELSSEGQEAVIEQDEPHFEEHEPVIDQQDASIVKEEEFFEPTEPSSVSTPAEVPSLEVQTDSPPETLPPEVNKSKEYEMPKTLRFGKFLLDQGDYKQALDIIHTYMDKPEYIEIIKEWLDEAVHDGAGKNSEVWESLGDIALRDGDPESAFIAYTKAINLLIGSTKGNHETY